MIIRFWGWNDFFFANYICFISKFCINLFFFNSYFFINFYQLLFLCPYHNLWFSNNFRINFIWFPNLFHYIFTSPFFIPDIFINPDIFHLLWHFHLLHFICSDIYIFIATFLMSNYICAASTMFWHSLLIKWMAELDTLIRNSIKILFQFELVTVIYCDYR